MGGPVVQFLQLDTLCWSQGLQLGSKIRVGGGPLLKVLKRGGGRRACQDCLALAQLKRVALKERKKLCLRDSPPRMRGLGERSGLHVLVVGSLRCFILCRLWL